MKVNLSPPAIAIIVVAVGLSGAAMAGAAGKKKHGDAKPDRALIKKYLKNHKVPAAIKADSATHAVTASSADSAATATSADTAKTADTAKNADATGGNHVTAIYYTATLANAGTPVKIFDRDGLTLTATCDPGNGPLVTAHTGKNNSSLMATSNDGLSSQQGLFNLLTTSDQLVMDYNGAGNGGKAVASQNAQVHINYSQPVTGSGVLKTGAGITEISVQSLLLPYGGGSVRCAVTGEAVSRAAVLVAG